MSEKTCQIIGLIGFIIAGILFVLIGLREDRIGSRLEPR